MLGTAVAIAKKKKPQRTMPKGLQKIPIIIIAQKARFVKMSVYSLDHPDIIEAERHGSLCRDEIKILGYCINCGEPITNEYEYFVDDKNNKFCIEECYKKYYGIKKVG